MERNQSAGGIESSFGSYQEVCDMAVEELGDPSEKLLETSRGLGKSGFDAWQAPYPRVIAASHWRFGQSSHRKECGQV